MFWFLVLCIVIIALMFIIAEVLFVPGGILGILGGILLIYAIYLPYGEGYVIEAHINTVAIFSILTFSLFKIIKHKSWRSVELSTNIDSSVKEDYRSLVNIGDTGECISRLTPIGSIRIDNKTYEAKSDTGFLDPKTKIEIINITKNEIIIKPINK